MNQFAARHLQGALNIGRPPGRRRTRFGDLRFLLQKALQPFVEQTDQLRLLALLPTAVKKIALFRSA